MTSEQKLKILQKENDKLREEKEYYRMLAQQDAMCGVYNKREIENKIKEQLKDNEAVHVVIVIDIDDLKKINDQYGHFYGDEAIISVANLVKKHFAEPSLIGRIGGDEFMAYIRINANKSFLVSLLNALSSDLRNNYVGNDSEIKVECSIGAAVVEGTGEFDTLYKSADKTMYQVKNTTKNGYAICVT